MIRNFKPAIILLLHIMLMQKVCGQASLNMTDYLSQKLLKYTVSVPREEIYIHTDRNEYISGEDIWFNIYLIDRQSHKPTTESKIAYFELLNPENRPIVQKRLWLENGFGPGQIVLPDTLSTGVYTIRAYTNWMKNFLPYNCFTKEVRIYNSFSNKVFKGKRTPGKIFKENSNPVEFTPDENTGLTLKADNLKTDVLDIVVGTNEKYRSENKNLLYLIIQTHGIIDRATTEVIKDDNTKISIPKKQLAAGINQITVFNLKGQPVGVRYIYTPSETINNFTANLSDSSGLRKKFSIELGLHNGLPTDLNTSNFSISVSPVTNYSSIMDIDDYLIFGTEFGSIPGNIFKNKKVNEIPPAVIDSLLENVKSNWINWSFIVTGEQHVLKNRVEKDDHYLAGKLFSSDQKAGVPDRFVLMSFPGKTAVFQYAKTDENGNFSFKIHIDEKIKDLIFLPDIITNNQSVKIESSFSDQYVKYNLSVDSANNLIPGYISSWSVNHQVRKIYGTSDIGNTFTPVIPVPKIRRFYGKPDIELNMKDYITLPVMQEVFFELLGGVSLKSKKTGYEITIANPEDKRPYDYPPCLFIDGVVVKDASLIAGLDPEGVEIIDVVREKYYVGDYLFYGIVNVITKAGNFSNLNLPDYSIRLPYRVIDPVAPFISPDYSSAAIKKSRVPDFRNTLYWNPSVKPDKTGKISVEFWTSDYISDFEVNIQGITQDGHTFSIKKIVRVKP
jgi:hypothetical protein